MKGGHVYLLDSMDWYTRDVVKWTDSPTLEAELCVEALINALLQGRCDIFNYDLGTSDTRRSQYTTLTAPKASISMDGRGRYLDNIFIEFMA